MGSLQKQEGCEGDYGVSGIGHPDNQTREQYYSSYHISMPPPPLKQDVHKGTVVRANSMEEVEALCRQPLHKGIYWERGEHPHAQEMEEWVAVQEEDDYSSFWEQKLMVNKPKAKECEDGCCHFDYDEEGPLKGPEDVKAACAEMASKLPPSFRDEVRADAEALAEMMMRLNPEAPFLCIAIQVIARNRCSRWHQDNYIGRAIMTYAGPSTWMVDDRSVSYPKFRATYGQPEGISSPAIVPRYESIYMPPSNTIQIMKGNQWAGITDGMGLVHKSPNVASDAQGNPLRQRFVLKVDVH